MHSAGGENLTDLRARVGKTVRAPNGRTIMAILLRSLVLAPSAHHRPRRKTSFARRVLPALAMQWLRSGHRRAPDISPHRVALQHRLDDSVLSRAWSVRLLPKCPGEQVHGVMLSWLELVRCAWPSQTVLCSLLADCFFRMVRSYRRQNIPRSCARD